MTSIPDIRKRFRVYAEVWEGASLRGKLRLILSLAVPPLLRKTLQRLLDVRPASYVVSVTYNLVELKRQLEAEGILCQITDFAANFWSRSYRNTRSNLLIQVPDRYGSERTRAITAVRHQESAEHRPIANGVIQ